MSSGGEPLERLPSHAEEDSVLEDVDDQDEILEDSPVEEDDTVSLTQSIRVNPQDATLRQGSTSIPVDFNVTVHDEDVETPAAVTLAIEDSPSNNGADSSAVPHQESGEAATAAVSPVKTTVQEDNGHAGVRDRRRKRPRGRTVRMASFYDETAAPSKLPPTKKGVIWPSNHYECTLIRRAVRKSETPVTRSPLSTEKYDEFGDVSLGMKLTVIGGKVIVQKLNDLEDGRASPAQLAGVVQRGDVLLSINDVSLVNLPIDQLMRGLAPLSTPDANGVYQKKLKLRFASGEGLFILNRGLAAQATASPIGNVEHDGAADVFTLFPMVDQLSGMPLFDSETSIAVRRPVVPSQAIPEAEMPPSTPRKDREQSVIAPALSLDEQISQDLARNRQRDRTTFTSEYFSWGDDAMPELLRASTESDEEDHDEGKHDMDVPDSPTLSLNQFIERGRRAVIGALALSDRMESVDRGKDSRSLRSWKTTISLYSRASARRRAMQAFDTASVPVNFGRLEEEREDDSDDDDLSRDSSNSDNGEQLDADAQLLRLAAHDESWQQHVIDFLEKATEERDREGKVSDHEEDIEKAVPESMDDALSSELGSFLFGENVSKILTNHKKPQALPPDEITALLYDLSTKVSATIPDEIAATGSQGSQGSSITPYVGRGKLAPTPGSEVQLATRFVLDKALPAWLKSFRPLPWDQRRILWPLDKPSFGGSTTASSTFSDDSFTLESVGTSQLFSPGATKLLKRKNLRERIEDLELNAEARFETCFLATYYFTQKLLPLLARDRSDEMMDEVNTYVRTFGSYLRLHSGLAQASLLRLPEVINALLDLARYDPRHKELMKLSLKPSSLVFYEPTMLSSILERLHSLKNAYSSSHWLATIDICAAAYPDVQPWQVRSVCTAHVTPKVEGTDFEARRNELADLYYIYLTQLLHPVDGHDLARRDLDLVREWCELSIRCIDHNTFKDRVPDRRRNFFAVASRVSSDHLLYARDLILLLQLSKEVGDSDLELDLVGEVLEKNLDDVSKATFSTALSHLRELAMNALDTFEDHESPAARKLRRTLRVYQIALSRTNDTEISNELNVPSELLRWISYLGTSAKRGRKRTLKLVRFLADEANPNHVLEATQDWTKSGAPYFEIELLPVLQTVLRRAAHQPLVDEFSGLLARLRHARQGLLHETDDESESGEECEQLPEPHIWSRMSDGMVPVVK